MREWFESLDMRERVLVCAGAVVVGVTLFFLMVWEPLAKNQAQLMLEIQDARELNVIMQTAAAAAKSASGSGRGAIRSAHRSILSIVDETSKKAGLGKAVNRIQPEGDKTVRIWLEQAKFDDLVNWLAELSSQHAISLSNGNVDRDDAAGLVKARFTLQRDL